jgi:hypothetical protein
MPHYTEVKSAFRGGGDVCKTPNSPWEGYPFAWRGDRAVEWHVPWRCAKRLKRMMQRKRLNLSILYSVWKRLNKRKTRMRPPLEQKRLQMKITDLTANTIKEQAKEYLKALGTNEWTNEVHCKFIALTIVKITGGTMTAVNAWAGLLDDHGWGRNSSQFRQWVLDKAKDEKDEKDKAKELEAKLAALYGIEV